MKKTYEKPAAVLVAMSFDEHIATSGSVAGQCGWNWENYSSTINSECAQNYFGNAI